MKKILYGILFMLLLTAPAAVAAEEDGGVKPGNAYIPEDTVINLILLDELDSNVNKKGDIVRFEMQDDLTVENIVLVPQGTELTGTIRKAHGSRVFNQSAVIRIRLDDYVLSNGKTVGFTGDVKIKGGINYTNAAVSTALSFVVPLSGVFFKGREIKCPAGAVIKYKTKDDFDLGMTKMDLVKMKSAERRQQLSAED